MLYLNLLIYWQQNPYFLTERHLSHIQLVEGFPKINFASSSWCVVEAGKYCTYFCLSKSLNILWLILFIDFYHDEISFQDFLFLIQKLQI